MQLSLDCFRARSCAALPTSCFPQRMHALPKHLNDIANRCEWIWSYGDRITGLARSLLNISLRTSVARLHLKETTVLPVIARLKLFTFLNVAFNARAIGGVFQDIIKGMTRGDGEGVALGLLSVTVIAMDSIDNFTNAANALLPMLSRTPFLILEAINLPLVFGLLGLATLQKLIQIVKMQRVFRQFQGLITDGRSLNIQQFKQFFIEHLGDLTTRHDPVQGPHKKEIFSRAVPKEVIHALELLYGNVCLRDAGGAQKQIDFILSFFQKKINIEIGNAIVNCLFIIAIAGLAVGLTTAIPFAVLSCAYICKLTLLTYGDVLTLKNNLKNKVI